MSPFILIGIFIVSAIVGYKLISNVPSLLHTPLMSGMNALSGITVIGAIIAVSLAIGAGTKILVYSAIVFATINIVAGYGVTHRMLKMFKRTRSRPNGRQSILLLVHDPKGHTKNKTEV